ncbi:hypothetical protein C2W62_16765 [Candidatus Entotheonella serta]|nr:hypothetical protein C2W62_16765 [Candidatus Entotheonella serta]
MQRELLQRFLIRRVQYLNITGERHSKNMYRREWQHGGYDQHDEPIALDDPYQRLVVGLMQKKVAEVLGDRRFNNHFQIGMLSSFESFMETLNWQRWQTATPPEDEDHNGVERMFDANQEATQIEKQGIDSHALESVMQSYREQFGRGLPHPKLDATARAFADAFVTGDKALVFVRRVATVVELKAKLDRIYDRCLQNHMEAVLPELRSDIERLFTRYRDGRVGTSFLRGLIPMSPMQTRPSTTNSPLTRRTMKVAQTRFLPGFFVVKVPRACCRELRFSAIVSPR